MPPMENELLEDDFDTAVIVGLYLCERRRDENDIKAQANRVGFEVARILAPLWGGEVEEERRKVDDHEHVFVDGECRGCGLQIKDGVMGYKLFDKEVEGHEINDTGFKTKGSRRIISCEHKRHKSLPTGELLCLDCGSVGN
jgi:hypothetical protein